MKSVKTALTAAFCMLGVSHAPASELLMESSGCLSCHRVDTKVLGPAFKEVAARYKGQPEVIDALMQKVRDGGEGVWGDVPMAPNTVEKVSDANLRLIIEWVLSL